MLFSPVGGLPGADTATMASWAVSKAGLLARVDRAR